MGEIVCPVLASCRTRWRWLKVPRSASWPVSRTGTPSVSNDAKASASACAQSIPPSAPSASRRRSSCLTSLEWTVKPSGTASRPALSSRSFSAGTAVVTSGLGERGGVGPPGFPGGGRRGALGAGGGVGGVLAGRLLAPARLVGGLDLRLEVLVQVRQLVPDLLALSVDLVAGDDALLDEAVGED